MAFSTTGAFVETKGSIFFSPFTYHFFVTKVKMLRIVRKLAIWWCHIAEGVETTTQ